MMDRRTFTFASLLGIGATASVASAATDAAPVEQPGSGDGPKLRASWALERKGSQLVATLTVHNDGTGPTDIVVARGRHPGPWVRAWAGDEELAPVLSDLDKRELMSRVGPLPRFEPLGPGRSKEVGTYVFQLADPDTVEVDLEVTIATGADVVKTTQRVPIAPSRKAV